MNEYNNKIAVITGAASGIGREIAQQLVRMGSTVVMLDIDSDGLKNFLQENKDYNNKIETNLIDVTNYNEINRLINDIADKHGTINFMFNNAGIGGTLPFESATMDHWHKIIDLNLYGVIHGIQAVFPIMKKQKSGHIINTSSISGIIPYPGQVLYNTTKYAITGLTLSLREEARKYNISLSIVCPGLVRTNIFYKPIIGAAASEKEAAIPQGTVPVNLAVSQILKDIKKNKILSITPRILKLGYWLYKHFGIILR
ncbi:MAG: SDR family oxidoreductase [Spirochaetales bacterium]|nr:SDR family oxidoreductase [Spirochaetales bacterium]